VEAPISEVIANIADGALAVPAGFGLVRGFDGQRGELLT